MQNLNNQRYTNLLQYLKQLKKVVIAFSGGVDSTFLLYAAREALPDSVLALTIKTPYIPEWEIKEAVEQTKKLNIEHQIIYLDIPDVIINNPQNRCYLCKKVLFSKLISVAKERSIPYVCDGTNYDDLDDFRPGIKALKELNVLSPLLENKITKADIREWSKKLRLKTWDKPAYACLLTRLPFDQKIKSEELRKIEEGELFLIKNGYKGSRLRIHNNLVRIEIYLKDFKKIIILNERNKIIEKLNQLGYRYVTLDLEGYKMGSFN